MPIEKNPINLIRRRCGLKCNENNSSINFEAAARFSNRLQRDESKKKTNTHEAMNYCSSWSGLVWSGAKGHTGKTTNRGELPIAYEGRSIIDDIFMTCCALQTVAIVAIIRPCNAVWSESQCDCWPFSAINPLCGWKIAAAASATTIILRYSDDVWRTRLPENRPKMRTHFLKQKTRREMPLLQWLVYLKVFIIIVLSHDVDDVVAVAAAVIRLHLCSARSFCPVLFFIVSSLKCANKMKLQHDTLSIADETKTKQNGGMLDEKKQQTLEIRSTLSGSDKGEHSGVPWQRVRERAREVAKL